MATTIEFHGKRLHVQSKTIQPAWERIILLCVLGYEAAGCLVGGSFLMAAPDGHLMDMPVSLMRGAFPDFLIPGIILFGLGILTTAAFTSVLRKTRNAWIMSALALGGLLIWFWVEIAILQELHWLHAMWGLPVILGGIVAVPLVPSWHTAIRKAALACGIIASLLYVAINIIVPLQWADYSSVNQTVSELSAIDAPTRTLWLVLSMPYSFLMIAFAWGVWKSAAGNRLLRMSGGLLIAYGALGLIWPFAPMHLREALVVGAGNFSDTMHLTLAAITELIYLMALGLTALALGKGFRLYSAITFIVLFFFGTLTFLASPNLAKNMPTPFMGIWERINIGVFLLWVGVLAVVLWPPKKAEAK